MSSTQKSHQAAVFWWSLAAVYLVFVVVAAVRPEFGTDAAESCIARLLPGLRPAAVAAVVYWARRAIHFLAYAALAAVIMSGLLNAKSDRSAPRPCQRAAWLAAGLALAVAVLDEILQSRSVYRAGRAWDVALDLAGIAAGIAWHGRRRPGAPERRRR